MQGAQMGRPGGREDLGDIGIMRAGGFWRVHQLSGYSAHADCDDLVAWVAAMAEPPGRIKLVHGDPEAQKALAGKLVAAGYALNF
jgi:predicted metal-dependent RNase